MVEESSVLKLQRKLSERTYKVADKQKDHIFFASESVGEGHPDKVCDQISDGILDACLRVNPDAYCAMESATKTNMVSD